VRPCPAPQGPSCVETQGTGPILSNCTLPRNPSNKRLCLYSPIPVLPLSTSGVPVIVPRTLPSPVRAEDTLAATVKIAVAVPKANVPQHRASPSPVVAKGAVAATAKQAVARSWAHALPSPVGAQGTVAATVQRAVASCGVNSLSSPVSAKGTVAAAAQRAVARSGVHASPSPVVAKGLLAATANVAMAVPAIASASLPASGPYRLRPDNLSKSALSSALLLDSGVSFKDLCIRHRGDSCLANTTLLPHSAAPILAALHRTSGPKPNATQQPSAAPTRAPTNTSSSCAPSSSI
jgi:hypothetical protein